MYPINEQKNITDHFITITSKKSTVKNKFLMLWERLCKETFTQYGQYGICLRNGNKGVLTPSGNWSPVNQYNTNYTINTKIAEKINEWISNEYIFKGVNKIDGKDIKKITFTKNSDNYISDEIDNYFFWLNCFKNRIFVDQNLMTRSHLQFELFEIASKTMGSGTYGEFCIEYFFKKNYPDLPIYRTSSVRGDVNDMVGGCDLYTQDKDDHDKILKYQSKLVRFDSQGLFNRFVDVRNYISKGIDYLVLVVLNYDFKYGTINPDNMLFLTLNEDVFIKHPSGRFAYNEDNLVMDKKIDDIFHSKVFFEFFLYCTKNDIEFSLEVSEETKFEFLKEERKMNVLLPKNSEDFHPNEIETVWMEVIEFVEKNDSDRETMMNKLKYLFKD